MDMVKQKKIIEVHKELFELANSFAGEETGHIAVFLHHAANNVLYAKRALERCSAHQSVGVDIGTGESESREMVVDEVFKEQIAGCDRCRKKDADWYSAVDCDRCRKKDADWYSALMNKI